ncbi:MAG: alpha/beta hydrolase [Planctomycetaceae bacterium]
MARISLQSPPSFLSTPLNGWDGGTIVAGQKTHTLRLRVTPSHTPIVYVHGIMATVDFWPLTLPEELRNYGGCSISLPNHSTRWVCGRDGSTDAAASAPDSTPVTPDDFSRPIIQVIDEIYGGRPVRLVGWSTGGFAVLHAAAKYPEKVESVLSICGFARGKWAGGLGFFQWLAARAWSRWGLTHGFRLTRIRPQLFDNFMMPMCSVKKGSDIRSRAKASGLSLGMKTHDLDRLTETMGQIRAFDISSSLESIRCPVQILGGDRDPVIPYSETQRLAQLIPQARLETLQGCGHLYFAEAPVESSECMARWLLNR